jgi:hypothetical protein
MDKDLSELFDAGEKRMNNKPGLDEQALFDQLNDVSLQPNMQDAILLQNMGQIERILLTPGWREGTTHKSGVGADFYREYYLAEEPDFKLSFYYRGIRTSPLSSKWFCELLEKAPHSLNANEYTSLMEILRNKQPPKFVKRNAYTIDLNDKRVLVVTGYYNGGCSDPIENFSVYIAADGTGSAVQEMYFQAPRQKFERYKHRIDGVLATIIWDIVPDQSGV